jgi:SNF2 family DNA or RNA helicase
VGCVVLHGSRKDRLLDDIENSRATLYVINFEGLKWFLGRVRSMKTFPFDMLVVDESSYVRNIHTLRFRVLKVLLPLFRRRYILTGDPAPNALIDLFAQCYVMDQGATFGPHITKFRLEYFTYDFTEEVWVPKSVDRLRDALAPRALTMTEEDQEGLPPLTYNPMLFNLTPQTMRLYQELKRNLRLRFPQGVISAANAGIIVGKLQQFTGGAVYETLDDPDEHRDRWIPIHEEKLTMVERLVEERQGRPTVVAYRYQHELTRLRERFGKKTPYFGDGTSTADLQARWNTGRIRVLLAQEGRMSHGLNMQEVEGHIVWFCIPTSNEKHRQLIRRIWRDGQRFPVVVHYLIAAGTWDERALKLLQRKQAGQASFLRELRDYWLMEDQKMLA